MDQPAMFQIRKTVISTIAVVMMFLSAIPAMAAQNTQFVPIGYSEQGRYFAYEEFGTDEQNRVAYSKIYLIDLVEITHVVGTPIISEGDLSKLSFDQVRQNTRSSAQIFLQSLEITKPAIIAAMNGDGQFVEDRRFLSFGVPAISTDADSVGQYQLTLRSFETAAAANCIDFTQNPPMGFGLDLKNSGTSTEIYMDKTLPRSRECPLEYEINAVVLPFGAIDVSQGIGIISTVVEGREGQSRHFIAIPLAFSLPDRN